jgi:transcription elongation GreA/GreB family factor
VTAALKKSLKAELVGALEATLASLEAAHAATREGATHEEAKPENDKDTRALEQSYLARGQAQRIVALKAGLAEVRAMTCAGSSTVTVGSLIEAHDARGASSTFFIAPDGGGLKLQGQVQVLTPKSPLGAALLGKQPDDEVHVGPRQLAILKVY